MAPKKSVPVCKDDRISNLPDGILCHILSFMTTRSSVRTCILSTRWNDLFTFVPSLDFDNYNPGPFGSTTSFIHFVNSVLLSYNVTRMDKFRLRFETFGQHPPQHFPVVLWISAAIRRHAKQISISVDSIVPRTLPRDLFSGRTLTCLTLEGRFNVVLPQYVYLPCLETCVLIGVWFKGDSAQRLFQSCPMLKNLHLNACHVGEGVQVLSLSISTLKRFIFVESREFDTYQLVLNFPNLLYFEYGGPTLIEFSGLENLKSLAQASVSYVMKSSDGDGGVANLIRNIRHVPELFLSRGSMEALVRSGASLPVFYNLTTLRLGPFSSLSSRLLQGLLDNSPRLERLIFNNGFETDTVDENLLLLPKHVPACVSMRLKAVEFGDLFGLGFDYHLMKYFLKYAKKLELMRIWAGDSLNEQLEVSSAACRIVVNQIDFQGHPGM